MNDSPEPHSLCLSVEEALELLDLILAYPGDLSDGQGSAVQKLGEFCRLSRQNEAGFCPDVKRVSEGSARKREARHCTLSLSKEREG